MAPTLKINLGFQVKLGVLDPKAGSTASEYFHAGLHLRAFAVVDRRLPASRCSVHNMDLGLARSREHNRPGNHQPAVYECLRGGLDFTKDDENVNSQPFMRWRDRFLFVGEATYKAQAETGEVKGHYLNATAGTSEGMLFRAEVARDLGVPIIMHDYITGGFTSNTSLAIYCRDHGLLLHIHRAMHAVIDRQKIHGIHFRVLAKCLRMSGGDHLHSGTVVGKLEGDRAITLGFVDLMREDCVAVDRRLPAGRCSVHNMDWRPIRCRRLRTRR